MPKLYFVQASYFEVLPQGGKLACHPHFFVAAEDAHDAKRRVLIRPENTKRRLQVDAVVEVSTVDGFNVTLKPELSAVESVVGLEGAPMMPV